MPPPSAKQARIADRERVRPNVPRRRARRLRRAEALLVSGPAAPASAGVLRTPGFPQTSGSVRLCLRLKLRPKSTCRDSSAGCQPQERLLSFASILETPAGRYSSAAPTRELVGPDPMSFLYGVRFWSATRTPAS